MLIVGPGMDCQWWVVGSGGDGGRAARMDEDVAVSSGAEQSSLYCVSKAWAVLCITACTRHNNVISARITSINAKQHQSITALHVHHLRPATGITTSDPVTHKSLSRQPALNNRQQQANAPKLSARTTATIKVNAWPPQSFVNQFNIFTLHRHYLCM